MGAWQSRPLDSLHAVLLIDCLVIKVRGSQVAILNTLTVRYGDRIAGSPIKLKSITATATYTTKLTVPWR